MRSTLSTEYDRAGDVLYIVTVMNAPAISREEELGMVWRYDARKGNLVGLTLIEYKGYWVSRRPQVIREMSDRFGISPNEARRVLESVH